MVAFASTVDLVVIAAHAAINRVKIARDLPPYWDFSVLELLVVYVLTTAVFVIVLRRMRLRSFRIRWVLISLAGGLLAIRFLVGLDYTSSPVGRARTLETARRIREAGDAVERYYMLNGHLPRSLEEVGIPAVSLRDAWGFRLRYVRGRSQMEYSIRSAGAPEKYRRSDLYSSRLERVRT